MSFERSPQGMHLFFVGASLGLPEEPSAPPCPTIVDEEEAMFIVQGQAVELMSYGGENPQFDFEALTDRIPGNQRPVGNEIGTFYNPPSCGRISGRYQNNDIDGNIVADDEVLRIGFEDDDVKIEMAIHDLFAERNLEPATFGPYRGGDWILLVYEGSPNDEFLPHLTEQATARWTTSGELVNEETYPEGTPPTRSWPLRFIGQDIELGVPLDVSPGQYDVRISRDLLHDVACDAPAGCRIGVGRHPRMHTWETEVSVSIVD